MSYLTKHTPNKVDDLVFHDQRNANLVRGFADGVFDHHLLMHGPAGSGKTSAARMILKSRLGDDIDQYCMHGRELTEEKITQFNGLRNFQLGSYERAYFIIDEIDECTKTMRQHLRAFMNTNPKVTIICTTNHLSQLERDDLPFVDRFETIELLVPTLEDWLPRLMSITAAEGAPISLEILRGALAHHGNSARTLLRETEKFVAELRPHQLPSPNKSSAMKTSMKFNPELTITMKKDDG